MRSFHGLELFFRCGYFVLSHLVEIDLLIILAFYPPKFQQLNGELYIATQH
jgi:hypothetical protein